MGSLWLLNFSKHSEFDNMQEKKRALWLAEQCEGNLLITSLKIYALLLLLIKTLNNNN